MSEELIRREEIELSQEPWDSESFPLKIGGRIRVNEKPPEVVIDHNTISIS